MLFCTLSLFNLQQIPRACHVKGINIWKSIQHKDSNWLKWLINISSICGQKRCHHKKCQPIDSHQDVLLLTGYVWRIQEEEARLCHSARPVQRRRGDRRPQQPEDNQPIDSHQDVLLLVSKNHETTLKPPWKTMETNQKPWKTLKPPKKKHKNQPKNNEKPWNHLEKTWTPTKNHENGWFFMVLGWLLYWRRVPTDFL